MLGPKPSPAAAPEDAGEVVDTETGADGDESAELPDTVLPQTLGRIWASSMGMTFTVGSDVDTVHVVARWGAYAKRRTTDEQGTRPTVWFREQKNVAEEELRLGRRYQRSGPGELLHDLGRPGRHSLACLVDPIEHDPVRIGHGDRPPELTGAVLGVREARQRGTELHGVAGSGSVRRHALLVVARAHSCPSGRVIV